MLATVFEGEPSQDVKQLRQMHSNDIKFMWIAHKRQGGIASDDYHYNTLTNKTVYCKLVIIAHK